MLAAAAPLPDDDQRRLLLRACPASFGTLARIPPAPPAPGGSADHVLGRAGPPSVSPAIPARTKLSRPPVQTRVHIRVSRSSRPHRSAPVPPDERRQVIARSLRTPRRSTCSSVTPRARVRARAARAAFRRRRRGSRRTRSSKAWAALPTFRGDAGFSTWLPDRVAARAGPARQKRGAAPARGAVALDAPLQATPITTAATPNRSPSGCSRALSPPTARGRRAVLFRGDRSIAQAAMVMGLPRTRSKTLPRAPRSICAMAAAEVKSDDLRTVRAC